MSLPQPDRIVVVNDISVARGGATALALRSALELRARGHEVTFLTGDNGGNAELEAAGIEIVGVGQERLLASSPAKALINGLYNGAAARIVDDWIARRDTPATVYHLHGWAQILSPAIFRPLDRVADRLVLSAHDFFLSCPNGAYANLKSGVLCEFTPMSARCVAANCDRRSYGHKLWRVARHAVRQWAFDFGRRAPPVLAIHAAMRPHLARGGVPESSIVTLPNPVMPFLTTRAPAEQNTGFLYVGRLETVKGADLAAAAAARAGVPLTLVGEGPLREMIERDYPQAVCAGRLSPQEIAPLAAAARGLVMPSRYPEPYGLVAAEALWSGLPVIAADTAFLAADIVAAEAGFACAPRDTAALAEAMRALNSDDALAGRMSRNAYERTRSIGLTLPAWVDALEAVYQARVSSARTPALAG
jgi:glycosyltransferase involved in cell wall biosynthesis